MTRYRVSGFFSTNRHSSFTGEFHTDKSGTEFMTALSKWIEVEASHRTDTDEYGDKVSAPRFHLNSINTIQRQVVEL